MNPLHIDVCELPESCENLRNEVRQFAKQAMTPYSKLERSRNWTGRDRTFTKKMAEKGWLGMTWPEKFGGKARSNLERYVMLEELLAVGAPMGMHWASDRQMGPLLMRYSEHTLAPRLVPEIISGDTYICIGMSEPDSGSDLASIRTKGTRVEGGWRISGRKVWTSGAHTAQHMVTLVRTRYDSENRHAGLSQILISLDSPGVTVRPIISQLGTRIFNEVILDDVFAPDENLIGQEGQGWAQVVNELKFERSGPERFLSCSQLVLEMIDQADADNTHQSIALGKLIARLAVMRQMSQSIAMLMAEGHDPVLAASIVKDRGALLEQSIPDIASDLFPEKVGDGSDFDQVLNFLTLYAPSFSLRGGTREILRSIIARELGLR